MIPAAYIQAWRGKAQVGLPVPGANSLTFVDGPANMSLTAFSWHLGNTTDLPQVDRVQAFNNIPSPDGRLDDCGFITLEVTGASSAVPEPATYALIGSGLAALLFVCRKR